MPSQLRSLVHQAMEEYAEKLKLKNARILDVGIAGDPLLPGASSPSEKYKWFGEGNYFKTLDLDPRWQPDYVGDICATDFPDNFWDLVIVTQTLEHVWDTRKALKEIYRITKKWAIIDCPWEYIYHPEPPSFEDYWRISPSAMKKLLEETGFTLSEVKLKEGILTTALCKK